MWSSDWQPSNSKRIYQYFFGAQSGAKSYLVCNGKMQEAENPVTPRDQNPLEISLTQQPTNY